MRAIVMASATKDVGKLIAGLPKGVWVAISHDEERILSYDLDLDKVIKAAKSMNEENSILIRVPDTDAALLV
jgi:hypothetical protein